VRLGAAGDGDDGVDVGFHGELQGVGTDGGGGAVDYQGCLGAFCCWKPGLGKAEAGIEAQGCGKSGEGNGGTLWDYGSVVKSLDRGRVANLSRCTYLRS
jgi:hypothetical protein